MNSGGPEEIRSRHLKDTLRIVNFPMRLKWDGFMGSQPPGGDGEQPVPGLLRSFTGKDPSLHL